MTATPDYLDEHLKTLEETLLRPEVRTSAESLSELLADDFVEFGSSGRVWTKPDIIEALQDETSARLSMSEFTVKLLAENVALATYRAAKFTDRGSVKSLRCSIWTLREGRWQIVFHQGTRLG